MGSEFFQNIIAKDESKQTAKDAMNFLIANAQYDYGHSGYSGTIAEKAGRPDLIHMGSATSWEEAAEKSYLDKYRDDPRIENKWGPSGYFSVVDESKTIIGWHFFGWASS